MPEDLFDFAQHFRARHTAMQASDHYTSLGLTEANQSYFNSFDARLQKRLNGTPTTYENLEIEHPDDATIEPNDQL